VIPKQFFFSKEKDPNDRQFFASPLKKERKKRSIKKEKRFNKQTFSFQIESSKAK
jgi:hypothetical protein